MSTSTSTSSSYYYSSTLSSSGTSPPSGHRYTTASQTDPDGTTTVRTMRQDLGEPIIVEEHRFDRSGQEMAAALPGDTLAGGVRQITEIEDEEQLPPVPGMGKGEGEREEEEEEENVGGGGGGDWEFLRI